MGLGGFSWSGKKVARVTKVEKCSSMPQVGLATMVGLRHLEELIGIFFTRLFDAIPNPTIRVHPRASPDLPPFAQNQPLVPAFSFVLAKLCMEGSAHPVLFWDSVK